MVLRAGNHRYRQWGKRALDLVIVVPALLCLSPLLLTLGGLVWACLGRPVLFRQMRPGLRGACFVLRKFRTMGHTIDASGRLLPDARRLTPLGIFLRSTSLDELPSLINVLTGDMSLVGPRPLLVEYLGRYSTQQARRHDVRPGITGWAQINGRNAIGWEQRLQLDVWYVDHLTCWLDIRILIITLWKAVWRQGISFPGHATMHEFQGTERSNKRLEP